MNCPNDCPGPMEYESSGDIHSTDGAYAPPQAEYVCEECGLVAIWVQNQPLRILHNPKEVEEMLQ